MANEAKMIYGSSTTVLTGATTALTNTSVSTSGTSTIVELNNTTANYPLATATLMCNWSVAPTAGTTVDLYIYKQDIDSTNDEPAPGAAALNGSHYVGSFSPTAATGAQYRQIVISLAGVQKCNFAVKNNSGQSMPTGWTVKVVPFTYGPA
jgi:hypothetical protein